jgi:hypothetical protein
MMKWRGEMSEGRGDGLVGFGGGGNGGGERKISGGKQEVQGAARKVGFGYEGWLSSRKREREGIKSELKMSLII